MSAIPTTMEIAQIKHQLAQLQQQRRSLYSDAWVLDQIADHIQAMIWMKDNTDRYIFASRRLCQTLLHIENPDDAKGKSDIEIIEQYSQSGQVNEFAEVCQSTDQITREARHPCEFLEIATVDTQRIVLWVRKTPLFSDFLPSLVIGTVGVAYDSLPEDFFLRMAQQRVNHGTAISLKSGHYQLFPETPKRTDAPYGRTEPPISPNT